LLPLSVARPDCPKTRALVNRIARNVAAAKMRRLNRQLDFVDFGIMS
jgi:hypothetical protein